MMDFHPESQSMISSYAPPSSRSTLKPLGAEKQVRGGEVAGSGERQSHGVRREYALGKLCAPPPSVQPSSPLRT